MQKQKSQTNIQWRTLVSAWLAQIRRWFNGSHDHVKGYVWWLYSPIKGLWSCFLGVPKVILPLLAIVVLLTILVGLARNPVIVKPFDVPPDMADQGWTGEVLATRIIDDATTVLSEKINDRSPSETDVVEDLGFRTELDQVQLLGGGISVWALSEYIRGMVSGMAIGKLFDVEPTRILFGEVTKQQSKTESREYLLTMRLSGDPMPAVEVVSASIDDLQAKAGSKITRLIDPVRATAVYAANDETGKAKEVLRNLSYASQIAPRESKDGYVNDWLLANVQLYAEQGKHSEAAKYARRLVERKQDAETLLHYGWTLSVDEPKDLESAEAAYRRAISKAPEWALLHNMLGVTLHDQNRPIEALKSFENAVKIDPMFAAAHYNIGVILKETGVMEDAEEAFERAIEIDPDFLP